MSDHVIRYWIHQGARFTQPANPGEKYEQVVLAADYDRDTQALQAIIRRLTDNSNERCADHRMHGLEPHCTVCLMIERDTLTARLAACQEALNGWQHLWDMNELTPHYSSDGKLLDDVLEQTAKALAQEG